LLENSAAEKREESKIVIPVPGEGEDSGTVCHDSDCQLASQCLFSRSPVWRGHRSVPASLGWSAVAS